MSVATLSAIPESFTAGDTVIFSIGGVAAYPIADWSATLVFNHDGMPDLATEATVSGGNYLFTLSKEDTRSLPARTYDVAIYCTDGVERATIASPSTHTHDFNCCCEWPYRSNAWQVRVLPNLADERPATPAERMLAACEASILTLVVSPYTSTSFNGQSQTTRDLPQLMTMLERLKALVASERQSLCNGRDINIYPRFV